MAEAKVVKGEEMPAEITPTDEVTRPVTKVVNIKDSEGRTIGVKRPSVLQQFRLVELLGPELARNTMYLNMVMPVFWVQHINGEPLYAPATKLEVEAAIERLGEPGLDAVNDHIIGQPDGTVTKEGLKNASGTQASGKP